MIGVLVKYADCKNAVSACRQCGSAFYGRSDNCSDAGKYPDDRASKYTSDGK